MSSFTIDGVPAGITPTTASGDKTRKIRILHAVGGMNRGGTEILLLSVLRHLDRDAFECDILVRESAPGTLDAEAQRLGARIIRCTHKDGALAYGRRLAALLREYGPYDVVHSHTHLFDGIVLAVAAMAGVPMRVSHSHTTRDIKRATPLRLLERSLLRIGLNASATHRVGISELSYRALFGSPCAHNASSRIIRNGIEVVQAHQGTSLRTEVRREIGIPEDAKVLGHVGRFDEQKNHAFLLSCFDELCKSDDNWRMVWIGDGPLRGSILERARDLGRRSLILDLGVRADVHRILQAMDVFLFPSIFEGFGIALVEAQAHGLPCLASTAVPKDTDGGLGLVAYMNLVAGPTAWAAEASRMLRQFQPPSDCLMALKKAGFDMRDIVSEWRSLYRASPIQEMQA